MSLLAALVPYHIQEALTFSIHDALSMAQSPAIVRIQEPDYSVSFALTVEVEGDLNEDWYTQVAEAMGYVD